MSDQSRKPLRSWLGLLPPTPAAPSPARGSAFVRCQQDLLRAALAWQDAAVPWPAPVGGRRIPPPLLAPLAASRRAAASSPRRALGEALAELTSHEALLLLLLEARHSLLGVDRPEAFTGWQLARCLHHSPGGLADPFALLHPEAELRARGWIAPEAPPDFPGPEADADLARARFRLTPAGRAALGEACAKPPPPDDEPRILFQASAAPAAEYPGSP